MKNQSHATARGGPTGLRASLKVIIGSEYLRAIAAVICLSSCTTALVGWQFKAVTSGVKHESQQMAAFFGAFTFWSGAASLVLQWLLTGRVLRRLGLAFALFVVPVSLTLGSFGYLAFGTLAAVVTLRGLDQVLRVLNQSADGRTAVPAPAAGTDLPGQVVHRHGHLAVRRRTRGSHDHRLRLCTVVDATAGDLGQPDAARRMARCGVGRAAALCCEPRRKHPQPPVECGARECADAGSRSHRPAGEPPEERRRSADSVCPGTVRSRPQVPPHIRP